MTTSALDMLRICGGPARSRKGLLDGCLVGPERRAPASREAQDRQRRLARVGLFDLDVACFLEPGEVARQVSLGEASFALEVQEVRLLPQEKDRHDHQPSRLVNHAVEIREPSDGDGHSVATGTELIRDESAWAPETILMIAHAMPK